MPIHNRNEIDVFADRVAKLESGGDIVQKRLAFSGKFGYNDNNIPVTPLPRNRDAHFGRVFSFLKPIQFRSLLPQHKGGLYAIF